MILKRGTLVLEVAPHGAAITSLAVDGVQVLLQPQGMSQTAADAQYLNGLVGRVANRLAYGRVPVDGETHFVSVNEGCNTLHGGEVGWSTREWALEETPAGLRAHYTSPDGEMGFPGEVQVLADIAFVADDAFEIRYAATVERPTPVNLTHHLYFNLSGREGVSVLDHELFVAADAITACDEDLIPTGEILSVDGTSLDFRHARPLATADAESHPQLRLAGGIDHNFVLTPGVEPALRLRSPESGVTLEVETDQAGIQLYAGQKMAAPWVKHQALAIEPQGFPDAVNHPAFPSVLVRPGETYSRRVLYRLFRS